MIAACMTSLPLLLVVEDEPLIRIELEDCLQSGGFDVVEYSRGSDAIAWIDKSEHLRGLITDIRLGDGPDGWDVARIARSRYPGLPVIYVTGDSVAEWNSSGVPGSVILQKPYAEAQLLDAAASLMAAAVLTPPVDSSSV